MHHLAPEPSPELVSSLGVRYQMLTLSYTGLGGDEFSPQPCSGWFEAVLMNVMGPLFPLSKGMLIIFSSLITWLMRD